MIDSQLTLTTTLMLLGTASLIILVAYFSANFTFHKLSSKNKGQIVKIVVGIVFGLLAIYGTVMATKLPDGIAPNVRELAAMMAGIAGGPIAGTLAGFIGGVQRFTSGGVSALACAIGTILVGIVAGVVSSKLAGKWYLLKAAVLGLLLESAALALVLVLVQPFELAVNIVSEVYVPMVAANTIGLVVWVYLLSKLRASENIGVV